MLSDLLPCHLIAELLLLQESGGFLRVVVDGFDRFYDGLDHLFAQLALFRLRSVFFFSCVLPFFSDF